MPMCHCHRLPTAEHRLPTLYGASPLPISSKRPFFEASCARETSGGDGLSLSRLCIVYMYDSSWFVTIHSHCLCGPILYFSHHSPFVSCPFLHVCSCPRIWIVDGRSIKSIRSHDTTLKASKSICPHQSQAKGLILSNALWTRLSLPASLTFILKPSHVSIDAEVQANPLMSILYNGSCKVKLASGNDDTSAKYQYMPSLCCWEETWAHAKVVANNPVTKRHQSHLRKCSQHWQHT